MLLSKSRFTAFLVVLLCFFSTRLSAQESILASYKRNFIRADIGAKAAILSDAREDENASQFIGELYEFALGFALVNGDILADDPDMISLVAAAARGAGAAGNTASVETLWELFGVFNNPHSRVEILSAFALLGKGNLELVANLNTLLENMNNAFVSGFVVEYPVMTACISALGSLGDNSSFPILFSVFTKAYPQFVTQETLKALEAIQGNHKDFLVRVIRRNAFNEKTAAFGIAAYDERFTPAERGELAQTALEVSLDNYAPSEASLRYDAIVVLTGLRWSPASSLVIRNFYRVLSDYSNASVSKDRLLEAVACLGVTGTPEAAQALALQLGYINSQTEKTGEYDEEIVTAIINALGELGDKSAFDYLLHVSYLNYTGEIQALAREALNRLKW